MSPVVLINSGGTVILNGSISYGTEYFHKRIGQFSTTAMSGAEYMYDSGFTKISGILMVRAVSKAEGLALRTWIKDVIKFRLNTFAIFIPGIDVGGGTSATLNGCRLAESDSQGVLKAVPPDNFDVRLEYTCNVT